MAEARWLRRPTLRLVPFALLLTAIQRATLDDLRVGGVVVQLVLAGAVVTGLVTGPERGAYGGFVLGVIFDLAIAAPLGQHALAFGVAGYVAGFVYLIAVDPHWWLSMIFGALGAAAGELTVPTVKTFVDSGGWQGERIGRIVLTVSVFAALIAVPMLPLGRWVMCVKRKAWKAPTI